MASCVRSCSLKDSVTWKLSCRMSTLCFEQFPSLFHTASVARKTGPWVAGSLGWTPSGLSVCLPGNKPCCSASVKDSCGILAFSCRAKPSHVSQVSWRVKQAQLAHQQHVQGVCMLSKCAQQCAQVDLCKQHFKCRLCLLQPNGYGSQRLQPT